MKMNSRHHVFTTRPNGDVFTTRPNGDVFTTRQLYNAAAIESSIRIYLKQEEIMSKQGTNELVSRFLIYSIFHICTRYFISILFHICIMMMMSYFVSVTFLCTMTAIKREC